MNFKNLHSAFLPAFHLHLICGQNFLSCLLCLIIIYLMGSFFIPGNESMAYRGGNF